MENSTNTIFSNFSFFIIIAQLINLLIIGAIIYEAAGVPVTRDFPDYKPDES